MMPNTQEQMDKLKPGQLSAGCEACNVWLTTAGVDSASMTVAIKAHRRVHGGAEEPVKGEVQVRFPMTVLFKCATRSYS
jgi:hypothetical protein